jgi:hypothetical protein
MRAFAQLAAVAAAWAHPTTAAAINAGGVGLAVTSPFPHRTYQTRGLRPGVSLAVEERGPLAEALRARLGDYELCIDYSAPQGFTSCKALTSGSDLNSADLSSFEAGSHTFRAFLRPRPGADDDGQAVSLLTEAELALCAVDVPYATGALAASPEWVVALHYSHDAHVAALHFGVPVFVLEIERLVEKR